MNIPWSYVAIFLSLSLFYYFTQKTKIWIAERGVNAAERRRKFLKTFKDTKELTNAKE